MIKTAIATLCATGALVHLLLPLLVPTLTWRQTFSFTGSNYNSTTTDLHM